MKPPVIYTDMIYVRLPNGIVVPHTKEQYRALWKGVDREAAETLGSPSLEPGEADDAV